MRSPLLCLALVASVACGDMITGPRNRLPVSVEYRAWWNEVEACSGLQRDIETVPFYEVPSFPNGDIAQTDLVPTVVYIASAWIRTEWAVKHEMLHAHLVVGHPAGYFNGVCGPLMASDQSPYPT